jgi:tetratricopeptide (TPR) repeat protein
VQSDSATVIVSAKELTEQIGKSPSNAELYYQRAQIYFNEKYLDKSMADIEEAIRLNTGNALYHFFKGKLLYAMNQTLKASDEYEAAIKLKPDYTEAKLKLAELYYIVKEHQRSLDDLNSILAADPSNAVAYYFKGMNLKEMKDTAKAIDAFQSAYENDKLFYDAAIQLGLIYTARNNRLAAEYFSSAIRINPKNEEAYFARGVFYQQSKRYEEALLDYRKVIALNPSSDLSYYNVGYINFETQHLDEALRNWDICIRMNNANLKAYYMRGLVYEMKRDKEKAKLNYTYVLRLDPTYELARLALGRLK